MFKQRSRHSGFTLPEVLVTVAIVAVLAAMVVPAVTQQIGKADAPSFQTSVGSLRTAVTSFVSDVKAWPGEVENLQKVPVAGTDFQLFEDGDGTGAAKFTATHVARWKGPYDNSSNATGAIQLGYGWTTTNVLMDSSNYLVVELGKTTADTTDADELDKAIDNNDGPTAGMVRYTAGSGAALAPANKIRLFVMSSAR